MFCSHPDTLMFDLPSFLPSHGIQRDPILVDKKNFEDHLTNLNRRLERRSRVGGENIAKYAGGWCLSLLANVSYSIKRSYLFSDC